MLELPGEDGERTENEQEWTDASFVIELCRLAYYIVIVITIIITSASFDTWLFSASSKLNFEVLQ